ncbi:flagellin [Planktomarina temperata]|nr:flagellin [Planktomarina temperata]
MSMIINTNVAALNAQLAQSRTNDAMETSMQRLSTGKKINSASDDAAGMAIAARMESQIKGLSMAMKNAGDAQSLVDTAEGAHQEISSILQRMRELAIQSANDTNLASERVSLNTEITNLKAEVDRIANQTSWNGVKVMDGNFSAKQFHIGAEAAQTMSVSIDSAKTSDIGAFTLEGTAHANNVASAISGSNLTVEGHLGAATVELAADDSASAVAAAVNALAGSTGVSASAVTKAKLSDLGASAGSVSFTLTGDAAASISATPASANDLGALRDAINAKSGITGITSTYNGNTKSELILTHATGMNIAITSFDTGTNDKNMTVTALDKDGNAETNSVLNDTETGGGEAALSTVTGQVSFKAIKAFTVSGDDTDAKQGFFAVDGTYAPGATTAGGSAQVSAISALDISTATGANNAIVAIDGAIDKINAARGGLGAISNRLDYTLNNLGTIRVNTEASLSRVEDADFAVETSNLTKAQILSQAATAMLAQANASKQSVLSLLQG